MNQEIVSKEEMLALKLLGAIPYRVVGRGTLYYVIKYICPVCRTKRTFSIRKKEPLQQSQCAHCGSVNRLFRDDGGSEGTP